jgi:hypothetical protein
MIQDASVMRDGIPDSYHAYYKLDVSAGPAYTLDLRRLPSGFSITRQGAGLIDVVFPTCFAVRFVGGNVDSKVNTIGTANQFDVDPVNINPSAGTMQIRIRNTANPPAFADPPSGSEIHFAFVMESL